MLQLLAESVSIQCCNHRQFHSLAASLIKFALNAACSADVLAAELLECLD